MTMELAGAPAPARIGQATAVEQSRAVAEVFAQVQLARQYPRDERLAWQRMLRACSSPRLAAKAFYSYKRSDGVVEGLTIHVAVALARCWGNLLHGLAEMSRDDGYGQSEMQAFCWDLETNERHSHTFIVPHLRSTKRGSYKLEDPRDVYENNTNNGNRRWREAILKALPVEFVEDAENALRATQTKAVEQSETPLAKQIQDALDGFVRDFGIGRDQVEHKAGRPVSRWTAKDLAQLNVLAESLKRGDLRVEDAFAQATVSVAELASPPKPAAVPQQRGGGEPASPSSTCGYCMAPGHLEDSCPRRAGDEYEQEYVPDGAS